MREAVIGLDVGTTVAKAVLFDLSGAEVHVAAQAYALRTPRPGWAELDPEGIWQAVVGVLGQVASRAAPHMSVQAIALAGQGGTLIPCRADGTPTHPAITWLDGRSQDLVDRWQAEGIADQVRRISGWSPQAGLPLASIGWLRQARPDVFRATERFLSVNDFLAQRLTGSPATSPSMAGEMLLTDIRTGLWSEELCQLVGIDPEALSPILPATAPLGPVGPGISHLTGLSPETVVVNGGQDHSCEALALGLTSAGAGLLACGTAWVINAVVESLPADDPLGAIPTNMDLNYHELPGRWIASRFLGGLGACVEWWLDQCGQSVTDGRDELWSGFDRALAGTEAGCGGLIYLPPTAAREAQGSVGDRRQGGFAGLRLDHTWADMGRAILEGAAYELRWALEQLRSAELRLGEMWMIGGAAKSPLWPQIVADVSRVPVLLSQYSHGPALGAAILGAVGMGLLDSVEVARDRFEVSARRVDPQEGQAQVYDRQFAAHRRLARELVQ